MPSFILIHLTVWPQYTSVTDRTGQLSEQTVLQMFAQKSNFNIAVPFMVALWNRADHYIFILSFVLLLLLFLLA